MTLVAPLWELFVALDISTESKTASALRCGQMLQHLLVKGQGGEPVLLLETEPRTSPRADIRLKHIHVAFDKRFEVANSDSASKVDGNYCSLTCTPDSSNLHRYFVELMSATATVHDGVLTQAEMDEVVDALLDLFRKLALPPQRSVTGLWGELLLIQLAAKPGAFVDAWHMAPIDGFDFAFENRRIEVKTTERPMREHEFSLRQLRPGRPGDYVASVVLSRSAAGRSALDLARLISDRVDGVQQAKLWMQVLEILGQDAEGSDDQAFDVKAATDSIALVPSCSVPAPRIDPADSALICDVRFRANITSLCQPNLVHTQSILNM
jgi:hypothetical protein